MEGEYGEKYELIIYETDSVATAFFSNTILEWKNQESYPGLVDEDMPSGAVGSRQNKCVFKEKLPGCLLNYAALSKQTLNGAGTSLSIVSRD